MTILHLFSGTNNFTTVANSAGHTVISVDIKKYNKCPAPGHLCDIFTFDFKWYSKSHFDFMLIGFPCTTFSKASGGKHFKVNLPVTNDALKSLLMIDKIIDIIEYFNCDFIIENPTSALFSNYYWKQQSKHIPGQLIRIHQHNYGHVAFKQTDLFTSSSLLWMDNPVYRVNGKNASAKFDNLSLRQRQEYPLQFCEKILHYMSETMLHTY